MIKTKRCASMLVLVSLLACLPVGAAQALCSGTDPQMPWSSPDYYSVAKERVRARYVVIARSVRETWLGEDGRPRPLVPPYQGGAATPNGFDPYAGALYRVNVLRMFKGKPPASLTLFSENSTARFRLEPGKEYLLFITEDPFDPPIGRRLTIDTCGNSAPRANAAETLRRLRGR